MPPPFQSKNTSYPTPFFASPPPVINNEWSLRACLYGQRDSPVSEISLCSYFCSKNYRAFIWTGGLARLPRSRLKEARSRLPGWKFLHINTRKRASPVAGMKVQRYRRKLFLTTVKTIQCDKIVPASGMKFSHINTREIHSAYRAVSLSQALVRHWVQSLLVSIVT